MSFANSAYLLLLLLIIPLTVWYILKGRKRGATMQIQDAGVYETAPKSYKHFLIHAPFVLRMLALAMLAVILARPQTTDNWQNTEIEGIDIMLCVDVSTSMLVQSDKPVYSKAMQDVCLNMENLEVIEDICEEVIIEDKKRGRALAIQQMPPKIKIAL